MKPGIELIAAERERQVTQEGRTAKNDDSYGRGQLAIAGAIYALPEIVRNPDLMSWWPWPVGWWKPTPGDRVRELVKAGALIAAEIDRLQRDAAPPNGSVNEDAAIYVSADKVIGDMPDVDQAELERIEAAIEAGGDPEHECRLCGEQYLCDPDAEPLALCNACAQDAVEKLPGLLTELRALRAIKAATVEFLMAEDAVTVAGKHALAVIHNPDEREAATSAMTAAASVRNEKALALFGLLSTAPVPGEPLVMGVSDAVEDQPTGTPRDLVAGLLGHIDAAASGDDRPPNPPMPKCVCGHRRGDHIGVGASTPCAKCDCHRYVSSDREFA